MSGSIIDNNVVSWPPCIVEDAVKTVAGLPTIVPRFESVDIPQTEENRRLYRQVLFGAEGLEQFIGGVILIEETLSHGTDDGVPFTKLLADLGILPGIKVDRGSKPLAAFPGETITEGLDGLRDRLARFVEAYQPLVEQMIDAFRGRVRGHPGIEVQRQLLNAECNTGLPGLAATGQQQERNENDRQATLHQRP